MIKKLFWGLIASLTLLSGSAFLVISYANPQLELYADLSQEEANQMVSILLVSHLQASKVASGSGSSSFKILVPHSDFVQSVEKLRQSGFPRRQYLTIDRLFPSNQLVSSPSQETAKLSYLKEQRLEALLSCLEGVIEVHVIISEPTTLKQAAIRNAPPACTASIFIKHASDVNLENFIMQIKSLTKTSVSGLDYENISVVLQGTEYRGVQNFAS